MHRKNRKLLGMITSHIDPAALEDFKKKWSEAVSGVRNAHKVPIISSSKIEYIHQSPKGARFLLYVNGINKKENKKAAW